MDMDILKKALLKGIGSGVLTWLFYSLITSLLDKKPFGEAMFSTFGIIFLVVVSIAEVVVYYLQEKKKGTK